MTPVRKVGDFIDTSQEQGADGSAEFDVPASRGYDWTKRSNEIKQRDDYVCQRCGNHNGNYEHYPLSMEAHHIVPGRYLPTSDARVGLNLVTVCGTCHRWLEGSHVEYQLSETGRDDAIQILTLLEGRGQSIHSISREIELSEERVQSLVSQLERMNCVTSVGTVRYRKACPATSKSAAERATSRWKREQDHRQTLGKTLTELRQELRRDLDELEYALSTSDRVRVESAVDRIRDALAE